MQAQDVVTLARSWIGTPYHNIMAVKGQGCDCLGLIRGVYAEMLGAEPIAVPVTRGRPPRRTSGGETMLEAARESVSYTHLTLPTKRIV